MAKTIVNDGANAINQEVQVVATLASSIVHELKNYLAVINICAELSEQQLGNIKSKVKDTDYLIGNLQLQIKGVLAGKLETKDFKQYSIAKNIEEALGNYPFKTGERDLIRLDLSQEFDYVGNPLLTNHILYNLIKNALRVIANAGKGAISIKLESGAKFNNLIFKDTATGIAKEFLPKMFKLFATQSTAEGGTGVGLAFCKVIMQSYGGNIICNAIEDKFTEFVLTFPNTGE